MSEVRGSASAQTRNPAVRRGVGAGSGSAPVELPIPQPERDHVRQPDRGAASEQRPRSSPPRPCTSPSHQQQRPAGVGQGEQPRSTNRLAMRRARGLPVEPEPGSPTINTDQQHQFKPGQQPPRPSSQLIGQRQPNPMRPRWPRPPATDSSRGGSLPSRHLPMSVDVLERATSTRRGLAGGLAGGRGGGVPQRGPRTRNRVMAPHERGLRPAQLRAHRGQRPHMSVLAPDALGGHPVRLEHDQREHGQRGWRPGLSCGARRCGARRRGRPGPDHPGRCSPALRCHAGTRSTGGTGWLVLAMVTDAVLAAIVGAVDGAVRPCSASGHQGPAPAVCGSDACSSQQPCRPTRRESR